MMLSIVFVSAHTTDSKHNSERFGEILVLVDVQSAVWMDRLML